LYGAGATTVIGARRLPPTSTIDDVIDDYARIFTDGVVADRRPAAINR
jgi:hypothetical protein